MNRSTEILEVLKMQPLTEEEKASRHILGRWYGPIATCKEGTRNGRHYNRTLWEKVLNDELFHEKIANKCLFLELGHPADREEIDMSKVCACIPEMPKIINGDLCACVDILDTPNGKILKTLCDYGFIPGISSRGSGDVLPDDEVDPESFFLECWDIVSIPALKKARLSMCESLDNNTVKLRKALSESINLANEKDKIIMKESLTNLNIDLNEELSDSAEALTEEEQPWEWDPEDASGEEVLVEETETAEVDENNSDDEPEAASTEDSKESDESDETKDEDSEDSDSEESDTEENSKEETESSESDESTEPVEADEDTETEDNSAETVGELTDLLQEYDSDLPVEFEAVTPEGEAFPVDKLDSFIDEDEGALVISVVGESDSSDKVSIDVDGTDENNEIETDETEDESTKSENTDTEENKSNTDDSTLEEVELSYTEEDDDSTSKSADGNGDEEVIESLKEVIRQKEALETELNELRKTKTVGDAEVQAIQEKLSRYRTAFRNTSAEAAKIPELQSKIEELIEQLNQVKENNKALTEKIAKSQQLNESFVANKNEVTQLNEQVNQLNNQVKSLTAKLENQTKQYTEKLQERTNLAKSYKARFIETLTKYVESKASMLGVQPSEITSRLNESYSLKDVDVVCDEILNTTVNFSRLPFSGRSKTSARITESVAKTNIRNTSDYGYEIDDDLLKLAGLK